MASQFPGDSPPPITPTPSYTPPSAGGGMVGRIQRILTKPAQEWPVIDAEPDTAQSVFMKWAVPLGAIGPVASLIGMQVFGIGMMGITYKPPIVTSVVTAVLQYAGALGGVWVLAFIIDLLAPSFGSQKDINRSMKLAAYSLTPGWLAGILGIIPMLGVLAILAALYGLYIFWVGLPILKKTPADKAAGYAIVTIIANIVAYFVIGLVVASITTAVALTSAPTTGAVTLGSVSTGNGASMNLDQLAAAGQQMAANAERTAQTASAGTTTIPGTVAVNGAVADPAALQAMLPASVAGFTRTAVESTSGGAGGIGAATAKGTYTLGDQRFELSVSDVGALGGLATLGGALNVNSNRETATGYERTSMRNGNMVEEEWDNGGRRGKFMTMVASRFAVSAEGSAPSIDQLKAAVGAIDMGRLAAMAK